MTDPQARVLIRRFDATRDRQSLRSCIVDQQNFHRGLEPTWPDGEAIAGDYLAYFDAECAAHNGCIFMAECDAQPAGFVCVVATTRGESPDDPTPFAWVHDIYVRPRYRLRGVASLLMAEAERFARDAGAHWLRLGVLDKNEAARHFYARQGFRAHAHVLTKRLDP